MAEDKAKQTVGTKRKLHQKDIKTIQQALSHANETTPSESSLIQQLDTLDRNWGEYNDLYDKLTGVVSHANSAEAEQCFHQACKTY